MLREMLIYSISRALRKYHVLINYHVLISLQLCVTAVNLNKEN
jgi:hypothetical protein